MDKPVWDDQGQDDRILEVSFFGSRTFMMILAGIAGLIGVLILYYLFSPSEAVVEEVPVLVAPEMPYKVAPENPGGLLVPHQDKQVYERLDPTMDSGMEGNSVMRPGPETPMLIERDVVPADAGNGLSPMATNEIGAPEVVVEELTAPRPSVTIDETTVNETNVVNNTTQETVVAPQKTGKYKVQLAALATKDLAEKEWGILKRRYKAVLAGQDTQISKVSLPKKGTFYRVQIGPFEAKGTAQAVCQSIKKKGGSCFIVT